MKTNLRPPSVRFREFEGSRVGIDLIDGSRLQAALIVSAGRGDLTSVWLDVDGSDRFIEKADVVDMWATPAAA